MLVLIPDKYLKRNTMIIKLCYTQKGCKDKDKFKC